jgi:DNA-binding transcriptional MocR family regulator
MTIWLPRLATDRPRYIAIAEAIRDDVDRGVLKPGERLPTHRDLAYRLKVTTGTVTRAYAEAEKLGLLVGEVGRGSFVRAPGARATPYTLSGSKGEDVIELSNATPPAVQLTQDLDDALKQIMLQPARLDLLGYTPPQGHPLHRAMGAKWLARSGVDVPEDQVVVTSGAQAALISVLAALSQHGERLFLEGLNYAALKPIARHLGLALVPIESDGAGLVPESLERAARAGEARMLYIVPTLHNPTTVSLGLERRQAIADIARRYGVTILEDDVFRLLDPRLQPPTIFTLAPERTFYITSLSKTLAPGLRVGFVAAPAGKSEILIRHQTVAAGRAVGLAGEVARHWIGGDTAQRILDSVISENVARRTVALDVLRGRTVSCKPYAPFLWLKLPEHWEPGDFARVAASRGVRITTGTAFAMDRRADDRGVRICLGCASSRQQLHEGMERINALVDERHDEHFTAVA